MWLLSRAEGRGDDGRHELNYEIAVKALGEMGIVLDHSALWENYQKSFARANRLHAALRERRTAYTPKFFYVLLCLPPTGKTKCWWDVFNLLRRTKVRLHGEWDTPDEGDSFDAAEVFVIRTEKRISRQQAAEDLHKIRLALKDVHGQARFITTRHANEFIATAKTAGEPANHA